MAYARLSGGGGPDWQNMWFVKRQRMQNWAAHPMGTNEYGKV